MSTESSVQFGESVVQQSKHDTASSQVITDTHAVTKTKPSEREPARQSTCAEYEGQIITAEHTSYCEECELVVTARHGVDTDQTNGAVATSRVVSRSRSSHRQGPAYDILPHQ